MQNPRIDKLRKMVEQKPNDPRFRFGLALEYEKAEEWENAAIEFRRYLDLAEDEGNAWGRLGNALRELGRDEEAQDAYRHGIEIANRHGHPSMAHEFELVLEEWDD